VLDTQGAVPERARIDHLCPEQFVALGKRKRAQPFQIDIAGRRETQQTESTAEDERTALFGLTSKTFGSPGVR
jgi:hypothetical protein